MLLIYLNKYFIKNDSHKLKLESIIIIALTIIILEISYPILKPRVEIISIDDVYHGFVYNEKPYGYQYYTLSVLPPLFSPSCTNMILGYDVIGVFTEDYRFGTNIKIKENGFTEFCTPFFDFSKRILKLIVVSEQPVTFEISGKNLTRFWWINENDNSTRISETIFYNREKYPITFSGNVSYAINNMTMLDNKINLLNYLMNDTSKKNCRLHTFRLSYSRDYKSGDYSGYKIEGDKVIIFLPINLYVPPYNYSVNYIQFDPFSCDK